MQEGFLGKVYLNGGFHRQWRQGESPLHPRRARLLLDVASQPVMLRAKQRLVSTPHAGCELVSSHHPGISQAPSGPGSGRQEAGVETY